MAGIPLPLGSGGSSSSSSARATARGRGLCNLALLRCRRLYSLEFALLEKFPRAPVRGRPDAFVVSGLPEEGSERVAGDADGVAELADFHGARVEEAADEAAHLVGGFVDGPAFEVVGFRREVVGFRYELDFVDGSFRAGVCILWSRLHWSTGTGLRYAGIRTLASRLCGPSWESPFMYNIDFGMLFDSICEGNDVLAEILPKGWRWEFVSGILEMNAGSMLILRYPVL